MKNRVYASERLSPGQHYFGVGVVGNSIPDPGSTKKDRHCESLEYQEFEEAVPFKFGGEYLEQIPKSKASNYGDLVFENCHARCMTPSAVMPKSLTTLRTCRIQMAIWRAMVLTEPRRHGTPPTMSGIRFIAPQQSRYMA